MPKMIEDVEHYSVAYELDFSELIDVWYEEEGDEPEIVGEKLEEVMEAMIMPVARKFQILDAVGQVSSWEDESFFMEDHRWRKLEEVENEIYPAFQKVLDEIKSKYGTSPSLSIKVYEATDERHWGGEMVTELSW